MNSGHQSEAGSTGTPPVDTEWPGLASIVARLPDAVIQIGIDGVVEAASLAVEAIFGWSPDALVGQPITVLMGAPERRVHQSFIERYLETGASSILRAAPRTLAGLHKSGRAVEFELTIGEAWVSGERKFIGVCRDVSERMTLERERNAALDQLKSKVLELRSAQVQLLEEQSKVRERAEEAMAAQQVLSVAASLADLHVWELNYQTRKLRKWGAEDTFFDRTVDSRELLRDTLGTVHPADREAVAQAWDRYLVTGRAETLEHRTNRQDGREVWVSSTTELLRDRSGRPERLVGALQNISARKCAEQALVDARDKAEAATRAKSEFLSNMSHEIGRAHV